MYIDGGFRWDSLIRFFKLNSTSNANTSPAGVTSSTAPSSGGVYRVGGGVTAPRVTYSPNPECSKEARESKVEGIVILWLIVGPDGIPRDIRLAQPIGNGLDEKAIEAVSKWGFQPATNDGKPVAVQINVEVNFKLR